MEKFTAAVFAGLAIAFIVPILMVFLGALSGWIVGLVFERDVINFLSRIGVDTNGLTMWQLGAALGFLGSYFKTTINSPSKS